MQPVKPMPLCYFTYFQKLFPLNGVVVVGAGTGHGQWIRLLQELNIKSALLIEADSDSCQQLEAVTRANPGWVVKNQLIAEVDGEAAFYSLANRSESSLLRPDLLRCLWANIKITDKSICQAIKLHTLCTQNSFAMNCLIIDCLPSLAILRSAEEFLTNFDVIVPRMVLNQAILNEAKADQCQIDSFLQTRGYRCLGMEHERHPDLGHGLYIRDYYRLAEERQKQIGQLDKQRDKLKSLAAERLAEIEELKNNCDEKANIAQKQQEQIGQLSKQRDEQKKLAAERLAEIEGLKKACDEKANIAQKRQEQIGQLSKQRDEQEKLAAERLAEIEGLKNTCDEQTKIAQKRLSLETRVQFCLSARDVHAAIDHELDSDDLTESEKINFLFMLSDGFYSQGDKMTALHFLRMPLEQGASLDIAQKEKLVSGLIAQGRSDLAADIVISDLLSKHSSDGLNAEEHMAIKKAYSEKVNQLSAKTEHGHDLLLRYLEANLRKYKEENDGGKPVLIEIGTTRESVPEQGSTRKIAEFCKRNNLAFITVDMDPHNTKIAQKMFARLGYKAQAITARGEDFLRSYEGIIDFVFLDAYDFDHGRHSILRQSRYEQFLGERIDDKACHKMHLDCAQSIIPKLSKNGLICVDDTWPENDVWRAKGTLAVPYLIEHGFVVLEARNRAALLTRAVQCPA